MCTVTLFPLKSSGFILTSSRDEAGERKTSPPAFYRESGVKMLFPRDEVAGGTWIGVSERNRLICLLNGGYEAHERAGNYRKSRGVVTKEFLAAVDFEKIAETYNLHQIEPFTMIVVEWEPVLRFVEFVWDGQEKHLKEPGLKSHIWSSSPLYTSEMKEIRKKWFVDFQQNKKATPEDLWEFHHSAGTGDKNIDIIMDRGFVRTQSITQVVNSSSKIKMKYEDLGNKRITESAFTE